MAPIVEIEHLTKKFGSRVVVDDVSFVVQPGTILGLLGPNGAGKSTVINMIVGLLRKTAGEVRLFGQVAEGNQELRKRIGMVPQELALYYDLSAEENVRYFGGLYGLRGKALKSATEDALKLVGLWERKKDKPATFSGGMQRRLNIAMGIVHQPEFVIMDEPTVGIDPQSRNYIMETIEQMRRDGKTLIYTSHYMEEVERLADTIVIIDQGKVIATGTEPELVNLVTAQKNILITVANPQAVILADIKQQPGVIKASLTATQLLITVTVESNDLNQLLLTLIQQSVVVNSVDQQQIDLETVFLNLTGRNLRDK
ncbi:ABC transporter ATP-binding protein [Loigolactobacillus coryniformis]|jgi:ABC-2 type transport system ATP-binding protein|uniref:ABC transporter, ATP-binding protein n=2 Tax=Loigolactobacillus coryniformis TaxID=1610 RepID=A0A0R1F6R1_9LACO|nr:ABC transporter ATP-binding protein [Loigolactobacillus coryniformis]RRG01194.1 MAG: ABC transporter ATP-binding protein [Lactobacillus sp.]ATO44727.1 export ABC transporter ATP-binding protein [Loigolactobacillus coryniformis subsp. torquens DSM 20004 = KCTC 3535]ATO56498.1 export ABC transporter ATP-binding protein [Loigolactobacillus coryniformis subsp. coryniformis KCTC 3167 = DSM 20001]KRK14311.1 ABC transporter, ATP-binding protein [Loigolactobacillus coryniformis subsp. coryniformis K